MEEIGRLEQRLEAYPKLRQRMEEVLRFVEGSEGELATANEVEEEVGEQLRQMGREVIEEWARTQQGRQERAWTARAGVTKKEKKRWGG